MFTGIIERSVKISSINPADTDNGSICQVTVDCGTDYQTKHGDSVAINGCCLTVTKNDNQKLVFDVSSETLDKTNLNSIAPGDLVNLERAMKLGDRLDGHLVSGHVDGIGCVNSIQKHTDGWNIQISIPLEMGKQAIPKGSICLNGVSLTINTIEDKGDETIISLMLIPTTVEITNFRAIEPGAPINIEVDMIGKFVARLQQTSAPTSR